MHHTVCDAEIMIIEQDWNVFMDSEMRIDNFGFEICHADKAEIGLAGFCRLVYVR